MAFDAFIKFDGIPGEATDSKHKDEIELQSFQWGAQQVGALQTGGAGSAGKASFNDFSVVKVVDKASPGLFTACVTGKFNKLVTVTVRRAGGDQMDFLVYKFSDVMITSYVAGGSPGGAMLPTESVTFNYGKVQIDYKLQDPKTGAAGATVSATYDIKAGKV